MNELKHDNEPLLGRFHFEIPPYVDRLSLGANIALAMGAISSRLVEEKRTRTLHPDGRRENVAEHSLMLAKVAVYLAETLYPDLDAGMVAIAAINHDDVEAYVKDTATDRIDEQGLADKKARELIGHDQQLREFASLLPAYADDVHRYESQHTPEERFVRVVDKIMVLLIHIPNQGEVLRENYTFEEFIKLHVVNMSQRLLDEYQDFAELVDIRAEIAIYIAEKYLRGWNAAGI